MSNETTKQDTTQGGRLGRRDLLKAAAASGATLAVAGVAGSAEAATGRRPRANCTGLFANEAFPISPLVLNPFTIPFANPFLAPSSPATAAEMTSVVPHLPGPGVGLQDAHQNTHQVWPGNPNSPTTNVIGIENMPQPVYYRAVMRTGTHLYTTTPVRTLVQYRNTSGSLVPAGTVIPRLPPTTIYGYNGGFYGAMTIFAEYGKPVLFRIENRLDLNPRNLDRGDYGSPEFGFMTHLHNGHTAAESDGNPHHNPHGYLPGEWTDNLYLNYPAGNDETQKMSWLWFHDHFEGHTGANVYKGMAGLYPIWNPGVDEGNENNPATFRFPGVRIDRGPGKQWGVEYDVPIVVHDVCLDDGNTPHQDFHNGCGEVQPYNFGKGYFRHFPNHGFVGDLFCVNGTAFPVMTVKRRKYRFRFLGASISRQWETVMMRSPSNQPRPAVDLQAAGVIPLGVEELQGQYRLLDAVQCLRGVQIGNGGGLLPEAVIKDSVEFWPAMRPQVIYDFTRYLDGTPTRKGDVIWLVNVMKMPDGRKSTANTRDGRDPLYQVPLMKIVIGDDAPDNSAEHWSANFQGSRPPLVAQTPFPAGLIDNLRRRPVKLQRSGVGGEMEWVINGAPFDMTVPMFQMVRDQPEVLNCETGGGWDHPMHFHQEEFRILSRSLGLMDDDGGKDDVLEMRAGEKIELYKNFRSYTGKYVAHCHQLAHEDHAMMFGYTILPPGSTPVGAEDPRGPVGTFG